MADKKWFSATSKLLTNVPKLLWALAYVGHNLFGAPVHSESGSRRKKIVMRKRKEKRKKKSNIKCEIFSSAFLCVLCICMNTNDGWFGNGLEINGANGMIVGWNGCCWVTTHTTYTHAYTVSVYSCQWFEIVLFNYPSGANESSQVKEIVDRIERANGWRGAPAGG